MKTYLFGRKNNFYIFIIVLLVTNSCFQKKMLIEKTSDHKKITLFFLQSFHNDKVRIYKAGKLAIDTSITSNNLTGVAWIKTIEFKNLSVKLNKDTTFNLIKYTNDWNNFIFIKTGEKYDLTLANDTTILIF